MSFKQIEIGNQIWAADNLNTEIFNNGELINDPIEKLGVIDVMDFWQKRKKGNLEVSRWCEIRDLRGLSLSGKLYNWYSLSDKRGILPEGWRLPNKNDIESLLGYFNAIEFPYMSFDEFKKVRGFGYFSSSETAKREYQLYLLFKMHPKPCNFTLVDLNMHTGYTAWRKWSDDPIFKFTHYYGNYWLENANSTKISDNGYFTFGGENKRAGLQVRCIKI